MDPQEFREGCAEITSWIEEAVEPLKGVRELPRNDPRRLRILHRLPLDRAR